MKPFSFSRQIESLKSPRKTDNNWTSDWTPLQPETKHLGNRRHQVISFAKMLKGNIPAFRKICLFFARPNSLSHSKWNYGRSHWCREKCRQCHCNPSSVCSKHAPEGIHSVEFAPSSTASVLFFSPISTAFIHMNCSLWWTIIFYSFYADCRTARSKTQVSCKTVITSQAGSYTAPIALASGKQCMCAA